MNYVGETLHSIICSEVEDGIHTLVVNNVDIEAEIYNFYEDVIYKSDPLLGDNISDTKMLILKYHKSLVIESGVIITPQIRKKGMLIFVGNRLINNGTITMTNRGANAVGQNVYLYKNKDNSFEFVPATGASGGARSSITYAGLKAGVTGGKGTSRKTGGGGSGDVRGVGNNGLGAYSGAGTAGTSYSGGTGGGSAVAYTGTYTATAGTVNGGRGGNGASPGASYGSAGGTGNPGGTGNNTGLSGTGGLLIIYSSIIKNNGNINSNGTDGRIGTQTYATRAGGSGGGSVNVFFNIIDTLGNIHANGSNNGGAGSVTTTIMGEITSFVKSNNNICFYRNGKFTESDSIESALNKDDFENRGIIDLRILGDLSTNKSYLTTQRQLRVDGFVSKTKINGEFFRIENK